MSDLVGITGGEGLGDAADGRIQNAGHPIGPDKAQRTSIQRLMRKYVGLCGTDSRQRCVNLIRADAVRQMADPNLAEHLLFEHDSHLAWPADTSAYGLEAVEKKWPALRGPFSGEARTGGQFPASPAGAPRCGTCR
ncbi:hypothetical protein [Paraburkholderia phenoliruptrix]|uniref:Uncharacterized protein n=1 Tax=Paraburkholderia phenoliruptrix BR3459a TaxID=1229205 RepID=K0E2Y2_9BURK|nr:hypothetical protein [Paraburkholderia phenoliruptrix]AFT90134.1 hypothetical protein BUPH_08249 [Paraburkholderia phenoliruptrix BR3459a]